MKDKQQTTTPTAHHFFASSVASWGATTPDRTLPELIKHMESDGYPYNLFLVPVPWDTEYEIKMYQPQVEGTQWLGFFNNQK